MADYLLQIYTQEKKQFEGEVTAITLPGEDGYLGILANHAAIITNLGTGKLTVRKGNDITEYRISGGFLEVHRNKATILAESLSEPGG